MILAPTPLPSSQSSRIEKTLTRFLLFSTVALLVYVPMNALNNAPELAMIQSVVLIILPSLYIYLKKGGSPDIVKHGVGFSALAVFVPLIFNPSVANTGIYWLFGYPLIVFFFLGVRAGIQWTALYFISILIGVSLAYLGYIHLYFSYVQVTVSMIELLFFSMIGYYFVSDNEKSEQQLNTHLHYLQSIDRIEQVVHADVSLEQSMNNVLKVLLDDFSASRAWLLYPCNIDAASWSVPFEQCVEAFPGAFQTAERYPLNHDIKQVFSDVLASKKAVCYGVNNPIPDQNGSLEIFSIQAQMMIVIYPDHDHPWLLGMHQCDYQRIYDADEQRLFQDIAHRIKDALNQKLLTRDLQQASKQANAASEAKSEFLSVMSHELRTPLHGIIGLQDLLAAEQDNLNHEQKEHLMLAQQAAKSLRALVNDILSLSKVESGVIKAENKPFSLKNCLLDAVSSFVIACREKGIPLIVHADAVPEHLLGDEIRLRQVLINLIGNAVKFTEHGQIKITITLTNDQINFDVIDTGIGISNQLQAHIFEPFLQEATLMHTEHQGTGLGTTIAKRFVELMGGSIDVHSTVGEGSCFSFVIPCQKTSTELLTWHVDLSQDIPQFKQSDTAQHAKKLGVNMQCVRILLAEDDHIAQRIAKKRFQRAGISIDIVGDGEAAWEKLTTGQYDVLLTDIRMPKLDGIALTQRIREDEQKHHREELSIIGLSAHALDEVAHDCYAAGMNAFMAKPISPDSVLEQTQILIQQKNSNA